jgi:hypothetical protein
MGQYLRRQPAKQPQSAAAGDGEYAGSGTLFPRIWEPDP